MADPLTIGVVAVLLSRGSAARGSQEDVVARIASETACPPIVLLAIIDTENEGWDARAVNRGPGDDARGGAFGLPQITLKTARAQDRATPTDWARIDPSRGGDVLLARPDIAVTLAANLLTALCRRVSFSFTPPLTSPWLDNVAALYNSGDLFDDAPASTRNVYVPRFLRNVARRQAVS